MIALHKGMHLDERNHKGLTNAFTRHLLTYLAHKYISFLVVFSLG